jgi:hypothetical protein
MTGTGQSQSWELYSKLNLLNDSGVLWMPSAKIANNIDIILAFLVTSQKVEEKVKNI